MLRALLLSTISAVFFVSDGSAEPLHVLVDRLIPVQGKPVSARTTDAAYLRRVTLDFTGRIPTSVELREFLQSKDAEKRRKTLNRLLASPEYPQHMAQVFDVMLMERLGGHVTWTKYLEKAFAKNKPWDEMTREMLAGGEGGEVHFLSKRLDKYGQNPVDYPGLTRDIGRLFLGKDFRCAQCHDHLFIKEYKQLDFQGLFAFVRNVSLDRNSKFPAVAEKPTVDKVTYSSVFVGKEHQTAPRVPGKPELVIPKLKKDQLYKFKPDRKKKIAGVPRFSTLAALAKTLPTPDNPAFARNIANRLWFLLMGRGLVHPLDLHHSDNPPSHPALMDLLTKEIIRHKFDLQWMLKELALTAVYQRSTLLPSDRAKFEPATFLTAHERRMSAEQLLASVLVATRQTERIRKIKNKYESLLAKFRQAFSNPPREPEETFAPSLRGVLFLSNDPIVQELLKPRGGNLTEQLLKMEDARIAEELYVSILSRLPTVEEQRDVLDYLKKHSSRKGTAVEQLVWALISSTEFCVNH